MFTRKSLLITGETGSFGNAVLSRFLETNKKEIRVFSRGEKKQDDMRHDFQSRIPGVSDKIKFYRVSADKQDIDHNCFFAKGQVERNRPKEFSFDTTELLGVDHIKEKLMALRYTRNDLSRMER